MKIQSKTLFANVFILLLLLIVMWAVQYLSVLNQIEFQREQLYSNARLLLETTESANDEVRKSQLSQISGFTELSIMAADGTIIMTYEKNPAFNLPLAELTDLLGFNNSSLQANAGNYAVKITPDVSNLLLSFMRNIAFETFAWLIILVISIFWIRGNLHKPLHHSIQELRNLCVRISKAEKEFRLSKDIAAEFKPLGDSLEEVQKGVVDKLLQAEEELAQVKKAAYVDHLTGVASRSQFMLDVPKLLADENSNHYGVMAIVRTTELGKINKANGYIAGDQYISTLIEAVKSVLTQFRGSKIYRLNSSDFAILLEHISHKESAELGKQLQGRLNEIQQQFELENVAFIGMAGFAPGMAVSDLLALCDSATGVAQTKDANSWHFQNELAGTEIIGKQIWQEKIEAFSQESAFTLLSQTIHPLKQDTMYAVVIPCFNDENGDELPYRSTYAMAERLQLAVALDKAVIGAILENAKKRSGNDVIGIHVSVASAHDISFLTWLERILGKYGKLASRLTFEVTEQGLQRDIKSSRRFIDVIHRSGAKVTVKQFGLGMTSFRFFKDLKPDFVKIDSSYMEDIENDKNVQYFLKLIIDIAHRLGVKVIANGVESQEQKYLLESMFVDGIQGQYVHPLTPLMSK